MSADTYDCEMCGATVFTDHRKYHEHNLCLVLQARRKKAAARMRQHRAAAPPKRGKPAKCALPECRADFVSQGVTHRYCCTRHADVARKDTPEEVEAARLLVEMAPLAREAELVRLAAEAVPLLSREASFALWARCLGFAS
jgi:hypothetical protein